MNPEIRKQGLCPVCNHDGASHWGEDDYIEHRCRECPESGLVVLPQVFWWKCPKCGAQHGTPTPRQETCRNCGAKMGKT